MLRQRGRLRRAVHVFDQLHGRCYTPSLALFSRTPSTRLVDVAQMPPAQVAPGLYLGDRKDAKDRAALRRLNIQSIVNCTPPKSEDPAAGCPSFLKGSCAI